MLIEFIGFYSGKNFKSRELPITPLLTILALTGFKPIPLIDFHPFPLQLLNFRRGLWAIF